MEALAGFEDLRRIRSHGAVHVLPLPGGRLAHRRAALERFAPLRLWGGAIRASLLVGVVGVWRTEQARPFGGRPLFWRDLRDDRRSPEACAGARFHSLAGLRAGGQLVRWGGARLPAVFRAVRFDQSLLLRKGPLHEDVEDIEYIFFRRRPCHGSRGEFSRCAECVREFRRQSNNKFRESCRQRFVAGQNDSLGADQLPYTRGSSNFDNPIAIYIHSLTGRATFTSGFTDTADPFRKATSGLDGKRSP